MKIFCKIASIVFYSISGLFAYTALFMSFVNLNSASAGRPLPDPVGEKLMIIGVFAGITLFFMLIGGAFRRFYGFWFALGVVLVSSAIAALFMVLTTLCMFLSPNFMAAMPKGSFDLFNDYTAGSISLITALVLGIILIKTKKKQAVVL